MKNDEALPPKSRSEDLSYPSPFLLLKQLGEDFLHLIDSVYDNSDKLMADAGYVSSETCSCISDTLPPASMLLARGCYTIIDTNKYS